MQTERTSLTARASNQTRWKTTSGSAESWISIGPSLLEEEASETSLGSVWRESVVSRGILGGLSWVELGSLVERGKARDPGQVDSHRLGLTPKKLNLP